jgi:hypothetical protein
MPTDPLARVRDEPLVVDDAVLRQLAEYRSSPKMRLLPGIDPSEERERLTQVLNALAEGLICDLRSHPTRMWVMSQFQRVLEKVRHEDTEGREHFGMELERLMDILGIQSSDGLLNHYLLGLDL